MVAQAGKSEAILVYLASSKTASETVRPYLKTLENKNKFKRNNIIRKYKIIIILIGSKESSKRRPPIVVLSHERPDNCILLRSEMIPRSHVVVTRCFLY